MQIDPVQTFLKDYSAAVPDAGFTAMMLDKADAQAARLSKIRSRMINAAFFIGGAVAAVQVPKLWDIVSGLTVPDVSIPTATLPDLSALDATALSINTTYMMVGSIVIAAFTLWTIMVDQWG